MSISFFGICCMFGHLGRREVIHQKLENEEALSFVVSHCACCCDR
jgi:hypothetical protein